MMPGLTCHLKCKQSFTASFRTLPSSHNPSLIQKFISIEHVLLSSSRHKSRICLHAAKKSPPDNQTSIANTKSNEPLSYLDVDPELWEILDLCSDEELEEIYKILHSVSPFSPIMKTIIAENEPPLVQLRGRRSLMLKIENRFRFLAADTSSLLQGKRPGYREALLNLRHRLDVQCSGNLSTQDLETEVFLHVLATSVDSPPQAPGSDRKLTEGEQRSTASAAKSVNNNNWTERITAPIRYGIEELMPTAVKVGGALALSRIGNNALTGAAGTLLRQHCVYAAELAVAAARGAAGNLAQDAAVQAATRGLSRAAAQYGALRSAVSLAGPIMWGWLAFDLLSAALGTDYARLVRAVFIMAQVRLMKTAGFTTSPSAVRPPALEEADDETYDEFGSWV